VKDQLSARVWLLLAAVPIVAFVGWYIAASRLWERAPSPTDVINRTWLVTTAGTGAPPRITITFDESTIEASSPCGTSTTDWAYDSDGNAVGFGLLNFPGSCSASERQAVTGFAQDLIQVDGWFMDGNSITLRSANETRPTISIAPVR
jgi:hypothetical protein